MKRSERFLKAIQRFDHMVILTHSYLDPDAMASAWGLKTLIETALRIPCRVIAGGNVLHAENIKFIEMLCPPIELVDVYPPDVNDAIVFVDCQPTNGNHLLKNKVTEAAAVIDHHSYAIKNFKSLFRDVRPRSASCSTIIANYLQEQSIRLNTKLATALFLGASTDIAKQPILTSADQRAARFITHDVDFNLVLEIQNASYPRSLYGRLSNALQLTRVIGDTAICFGAVVDSPASMATLADFIARCEGVNTVLITAPIKNDYFITVRSRKPDRHAGELAEALTSGLGSGGGHAERAAGSIPKTNESCNQDLQNKLLRRWKSLLNLTDIPELPFLTT
jgi:nanoRNase/pAp phosphatase (c-di-AMP/oligoRNAs hydrolase)